MFGFQLFTAINDKSSILDVVEIYWLIPVMMIIIPFVYFIRIKLIDKLVHGIDLKKIDAELEESGDRDWLSDSVATTNTEFDEGSINELIGKLKRDKSKTKSKKKTLFKRKDKNDVSVNNLIPGTDSTDDLLGPGGVGGENYI